MPLKLKRKQSTAFSLKTMEITFKQNKSGNKPCVLQEQR